MPATFASNGGTGGAETDAAALVALAAHAVDTTGVHGIANTDALSVDFNGVGDGRIITDAAMTSGSAILTSASGPFTSADVGKLIVVLKAGGGSPQSAKGFTISSYQSATQVTLSATSASTISGATAIYGSDDAAAFDAAIAGLPFGGVLQLKPRVYMVSNNVIVPGGVTIRGTGYSYPGDGTFTPSRGAMIVPGGNYTDNEVVKVGDLSANIPVTDPSFDSPHTAAKLEDLIVYAANVVTYTVQMIGARCRVERCEIRSAKTTALQSTAQNSHVVDCIIAQHGRGTCVSNGGTGDNKYYGNQIRGYLTNAMIVGSGNVEIIANHMFPDNAEGPTAGPTVKIVGAGILFAGNVLGNGNLRAADVLIDVTNSASVKNIVIDGNYFYRTTPTLGSKTIPVIQVNAATAALDHLAVLNNNIRGDQNQQANTGYKSLVDVLGTNPVTLWSMHNNVGFALHEFVTAAGGQAPQSYGGNLRAADSGAGVVTSTYDQAVGGASWVQLTQAEYDALGTPDPDTLYVIVG